MGNEIRFILNGVDTVYTGDLSERLLDILRGELGLTGTKCGCKEGECGACAVLINGKLYNSCLVAMGYIDSCEVMTIEGYCKTERFAVLEKAFEANSAVQCGFCIPGIILASEALLTSNPDPTKAEIRTGISGNLCRCTGYKSIVSAIKAASIDEGTVLSMSRSRDVQDLEKDNKISTNDSEIIPKQIMTKEPSLCQVTTEPSFCLTLKQALELRQNPELIPYSGGTDLMVHPKLNARYIYLHNIPEMMQITKDDKYIRIGASCTYTEIIEHVLTPQILKDACFQVAAPAIRNAGSIGGNVANGSPKADSALILMVTDSLIRIASSVSERIIPIKDFYLGRNKTVLKPDELIIEILIPNKNYDNYYYKKVGPRKALAIARLSFAGIINIENGIIKHIATSFGAVSEVITRYPEIDQMLIGKTIREAEELIEEYLKIYNNTIKPIKGRVSQIYRQTVCSNLLRDFLVEKLKN